MQVGATHALLVFAGYRDPKKSEGPLWELVYDTDSLADLERLVGLEIYKRAEGLDPKGHQMLPVALLRFKDIQLEEVAAYKARNGR